MNKTSLLVVGLVRGGAWARDIVKTHDLEIAGIVDVDEERLDRSGNELGVPPVRRFSDFNKALDTDADIVVVATPTPLHKEMSLAALEAGHHVICEKPLTVNLDEARSFRSAVHDLTGGAVGNGALRFMVGENYRFGDGCVNLKRAVAEGMIGRPAYVDHKFFRASAPGRGVGPPTPPGQAPAPHRSIPEMAVHHFDMWYFITGQRPVEIRTDPFNPGWGQTGRTFGYSMRASLEGSATVHYLMTRALSRPQTPWPGVMWVVGDEGALSWDGAGAVLHHRQLPSHDYREQHEQPSTGAAGAQGVRGQGEGAVGEVSYVNRDSRNTNPPALFGNSTMTMVRELVSAIQEGRTHQNTIEENWISFATAMAALESAETGKAVKVPSE